MKSGLYGQRLSLMEELKAETYAAHARLQAAPFFQALAACRLPLESYVALLRSLAVVHGSLELALANCSDHRLASVWKSGMHRLPLLLGDIRYFEPRGMPDLREAADAALETADHIRLRSVFEPLSLLGFLYVLEGSARGGVVLRPWFRRALLLEDEEGVSYLSGDASAVHARWEAYRRSMNALSLKEEERGQVILAARELFTELHKIYGTLYPIHPESRTRMAISINPEAGRHPVPEDPHELEASLKAADRCWRRFPYFEARYGERGRRFARSDAAWLATLCRCDPPQIGVQVRWLAGVLAARGMPTLLLQVQLELLAEALQAARPENKSEYDKLSHAAAELRQARRTSLADNDFRTLSTDIDAAMGPESGARMRAGELIAAAVADEASGIENAVESLCSWLLDADRLSSERAAAVNGMLANVRRQTEG